MRQRENIEELYRRRQQEEEEELLVIGEMVKVIILFYLFIWETLVKVIRMYSIKAISS